MLWPKNLNLIDRVNFEAAILFKSISIHRKSYFLKVYSYTHFYIFSNSLQVSESYDYKIGLIFILNLVQT